MIDAAVALAPASPVTAAPDDPGQARYLSRSGRVAEHRMLLIALVICVLMHGTLLLAGSYQHTYDAYVHIFFADHYARWWWSSWDPRWYTGFSTVSYPPGSHQSIALVSKLIGLPAGFVVVQLCALLNCTVGVYRWSRIWVSQEAAGWAAIAFVLSSSIAETVHVFGQLPTTFSLGFLLNSLPAAYRWVRDGARKQLVVGIAGSAATTAGHHVTTLFGSVFFLGPVLVVALVERLRVPLPGEPAGTPAVLGRHLLWPVLARRLRRISAPLLRAGLYGFLVICSLIIVVLPYWIYSHTNPILQVTIPHASRDSFIQNRSAGLVFWLIPWGTTLIALPYAIVRGLASRAWPLALSLGLLTLLGTGGTTPIPRILLRGAYNILTLDRFTFWATISILPMVGQFVHSIIAGSLRQLLLQQLGRRMSAILPILLLLGHLCFTLFSINLVHYRPFQPASIDVKPIVAFLEKDNHAKWRYITLGFGDQMAWLGANTLATTVDGDYHSARELPELTSRPIERLEGAKYGGVAGIGSLQQFLATPERYSLKYAFVNDHFYDPLLNVSGWVDLGPLENGIEVWQRADVPPLAAVVDRQIPLWQRAMWGTFPPGAIAASILLLSWSAIGQPVPRRVRRTVDLVLGLTARTPVVRVWQGLDQRLERTVARLPDTRAGGPEVRWQPWSPLVDRFRRASRRMISPNRRRPQALAVALVILLTFAGTAAKILLKPEMPPSDVVFHYYDDLDFRRFDQAYARLDPTTRPAYDTYRTDLGADGGLVASFAQLDEIRTKVVDSSAGRVVVQATLVYLTSLERFSSVERIELRQRDDQWFMELSQTDPTQPPEQFTTRQATRYISLSPKQVTSGSARAAASPDRPQLVLSQVRSLRVQGRWLVIGKVTNVDVDPADVTVTAQLRDPDHDLLASWNASQILVHQLDPGETSPFRLEFQSIAGSAAIGGEAKGGVLHVDESSSSTHAAAVKTVPVLVGPTVPLNGPVEFDPTSITPLALSQGAQVASVDVYAQATITSRNLTRGLQLMDLHVTHTAAGTAEVSGRLRNDTPDEIAVPHLLISYYDKRGALVWVDHTYLPSSIGTLRSTAFAVPLSSATGISRSGVPTTAYAGDAHRLPARMPPVMLKIPAGKVFSGLSIDATGYVRGSGS